MKQLLALVTVLIALPASGAEWYGMEKGPVPLQMAGPMTFGPEGILFVGDPKSAAVFAINTGDREGSASSARYEIHDLDKQLAKALGGSDVRINDLVVNPLSGSLYISASADGQAAVVRVHGAELQPLPISNIAFSEAKLPNPPEDKTTGSGRRQRNPRNESITDLAFIDGRLIVSGAGGGTVGPRKRSPASLVSLDFPFRKADKGSEVEIYHGAHGGYESWSTVKTFIPFKIDGEAHLLTAHTCTPLVKFPVSDLTAGAELKGTTVAELGNRNQPLDMISYEKDGKNFLLLSNSARGVMKISTDGLGSNAGITEPVRGGGVAGQSYETVDSLQGVSQMDRLNDTHAVVIVDTNRGTHLQTVALP